MKVENAFVSAILGGIPAIIIVVVNVVLKSQLAAIADWEVHWTQTGQEASYTQKFIRAQFFNLTITPVVAAYFVKGYDGWWKAENLFSQVFTVLLTDMAVPPFTKCLTAKLASRGRDKK